MTSNKTQPCRPEQILDYIAKRLGSSKAREMERHLQECAKCRRIFDEYQTLGNELDDLRSQRLEPEAKSAIWRNLQPEIERSQNRIQTRYALNIIRKSPRLVVAASLTAFIVTIGFLYMIQSHNRPPNPGGRITVSQETNKSFHFPVGADVSFSPESTAIIQAADETSGIIMLESGSITANVDKLNKTKHFQVQTEDAIVTVKGTQFSVRKLSPQATRVSVSEGRVWVEPKGKHRERLVLNAGDSTRILGQTAYLADLRTQGEQAMADDDFKSAADFFNRYLQSAASNSGQEVGFLLADAYERAGRQTEAVQVYEILIQTQQALQAENAFAGMAALYDRHSEGSRACAVWKRYLHRFPSGNFLFEALYRLAKEECRHPSRPHFRRFMEQFGDTESGIVLRRQCPTGN